MTKLKSAAERCLRLPPTGTAAVDRTNCRLSFFKR